MIAHLQEAAIKMRWYLKMEKHSTSDCESYGCSLENYIRYMLCDLLNKHTMGLGNSHSYKAGRKLSCWVITQSISKWLHGYSLLVAELDSTIVR